jgi:hypothetical protein
VDGRTINWTVVEIFKDHSTRQGIDAFTVRVDERRQERELRPSSGRYRDRCSSGCFDRPELFWPSVSRSHERMLEADCSITSSAGACRSTEQSRRVPWRSSVYDEIKLGFKPANTVLSENILGLASYGGPEPCPNTGSAGHEAA